MNKKVLLVLCLGLAFCRGSEETRKDGFIIQSPDFRNGQRIPDTFTCNGANISPEIVWSGVPQEAKSLALTVEDLSAGSRIIVHWTVYNIPPSMSGLPQGVPERPQLADGSRQAYNWESRTRYMGPCPGLEHHQYAFRLYALNSSIEEDLPLNAGKVIQFIEEHTLAKTELVGIYR